MIIELMRDQTSMTEPIPTPAEAALFKLLLTAELAVRSLRLYRSHADCLLMADDLEAAIAEYQAASESRKMGRPLPEISDAVVALCGKASAVVDDIKTITGWLASFIPKAK